MDKKCFITLAHEVNVVKLFCQRFTNFRNKPDCFSMASLSSLIECLQVRHEPTTAKRLSGAPLYGRLLVVPTNIRLGWKSLPETNILTYYENFLITDKKSFIKLAPEVKL